MRDYSDFDSYLNSLQRDIYSQPADPGHTLWAKSSLKMMPMDIANVLDVGCGTGFLKNEFLDHGIMWTGITLGDRDIQLANEHKVNGIIHGDFTFTGFPPNSFDLVYARHSLEHSPFPLITLMHWYHISAKYLLLVAPSPDFWGYHGQNHYSVLNESQLWNLLDRSGWEILDREYLWTYMEEFMDTYRPEVKDDEKRKKLVHPGPPKCVEFRYLCRKVA